MRRLLQLVTVLLPIMLSSCAVYSTGFTCPDSLGAKCVMLSQVNRMVDSGEIETVYMDKKCKKGRCKAATNVPQKALNEMHKIKLEPTRDENRNQYQDGEYLYIR